MRSLTLLFLLGLALQLPQAANAQQGSAASRRPLPRKAAGQRLHLKEIALKLATPNHPIYGYYLHYHQYFNRPQIRLHKVPEPAKQPSPFEQELRRLWRPEKLDRQSPITDRPGPLPEAFPWASAATSQTNFHETSFFRGAVINALAQFADRNGYLEVGELRKKLGANPLEQDILKMVEAPQPKKPPAGITWNNVLEHLTRGTLAKMSARLERGLRPRDMHALRWVRRSYDPEARLGGIKRVWAKQHILGNTHEFLEATGLRPERVEVWGKVYSLDPRAAAGMERAGFRVHGDPVQSQRQLIERQIARELRAIKDPKKHSKPLFLLLDDGGELIEIAANFIRRSFPEHAHLFAAVEQTQGGMNRIAKVKLPFRVIGSGSSWSKKKYGSPMFGYAVARAADRLIEENKPLLERFYGQRQRQLTVLGFGDIGQHTARYFKDKGYDVVVYDKDPAKRQAARAEGFKAPSRKATALQHANYLVSCVGRPAFRHSSYWQLPHGAMLINGASANELPRQGEPVGLPKFTSDSYRGARNTFRNLLSDDPRKKEDVKVKNLFFVRDGGVVNFPLEINNPRSGKLIPGRYIQLQLGLLYLDLLQAADGGPAGVHQTPLAQQKALMVKVEGLLNARGESLLSPRW